MAEAEILGMIQHLESSIATCTYTRWGEWELPEAKIKELTDMLDFLRKLKMEERSRLKYLMADLVELAQDVMEDNYFQYRSSCRPRGNIPDLNYEIMMTKMRMINFGVCEENAEGGGEEEEVAVGLEKEVKQLLDKTILNKDKHLWSLCIKGMIGIGKTTLARQVCKAVDGKFKCHAWVCLSRFMSKKEIFMKLIQQMVVGYEGHIPSLEEMDNKSLQQMLHHHLQGMPYFIVFDNMPKEMKLKSIVKCLPHEEYGSRLLITSRFSTNEQVLNYTHDMKSLDHDKSWKLFLNTIFINDDYKFTKDLERKGREMLKRCWGLPLAIIDVARQKAKQRLSGIEWEELFDSIDLSESLRLLEPMYDELDEELKSCFLHMPLLKENAIIRKEKLDQIWAASGLWKQKYTAYGLVSESIVEVIKQPFYYGPDKYRLHPLLHMLSIKKAEEVIGLEIFRSNGNSRPSQNPRHRVIHCGREMFNHSTNHDNKHLISLIFHGGGAYLNNASPSYWKSFELLNILDMEDFGVKTLSDAIGTLTELRYLGLRNNYLTNIPHWLGDLENLGALDIALNFMVELPDIIWKMRSLHHIHMSDVICPKPLKIDRLRHLETLRYISIYDWTYDVWGLAKMTSLDKLGIDEVDENSDIDKLFASVALLEKLTYLILRGFRFKSMPCLDEINFIDGPLVIKLDGLLSRLPVGLCLQHMSYLTLVNNCLDEDPMPLLQKLSNLRGLKLQNAYMGREMVIQPNGFPKLRILRVNELWNIRNLYIGEGAMSAIEQLEIKNCPHLETLPEEIGSMKKLKKFMMVTTKHIATRIRNSGLTSAILEEEIYP